MAARVERRLAAILSADAVGVNVAARLESLAEPGGICISGTAFDPVEGKLALARANET
jgi:class 3 adenylate cyclase